MSFDLESFLAATLAEHQTVEPSLTLQLHDLAITIKSNSRKLIAELLHYFRHIPTSLNPDSKQLSITALELPAPRLSVPLENWQREAGKTGRKESVLDLNVNKSPTRLIHKVRTGMFFVQSENALFALGPCEQNPNQIINFINNQILNYLQQSPSALCHAAALVHNDCAIAISGLSGGGKSTLMLHLLEETDSQFMSNDRLVAIKKDNQHVMAYGIPKLPRVNPGTLLNQASLTHILSVERQQALAKLPLAELWQFEEKYDVDIESWLGKHRIVHTAPLKAFIILNWSRDTAQQTQLSEVTLSDRQDLLPAVMKSYGPFYQYPDGHFLSNGEDVIPADYLAHLSHGADLQFYELSGKINFSRAVELIKANIINSVN